MSQPLEHTYIRSGIMLPLLFILLLYSRDFPFLAVAQMPDVHVLNLVFETKELTESVAIAYNHGFNASLWSRNFTVGGRRVNIIPMAPDPDKVASRIEEAVGNSKDLFVVLGPASAPHTTAALPVLREKEVVAFGPITELSSARIWDKHLYYFFVNAYFSVHALMRHAVINMRVRRLGFMYATNTDFGDREYEYARKTMKGMNRELCGVFSIDGRVSYSSNNKEFNEKWEKFAETLPQAVIIISLPNSAVEIFAQKMLKDPRTSSAYLMVPTLLERMTLDTWEAAGAGGAPTFPRQVITAATYPSPADTSFAMVRKYRSVIDIYFEQVLKSENSQWKAIYKQWIKSGDTLAGWVAGEILFQAIYGFNPALNRTEFISSLFNQRTYIVEDGVIGTYGGEVSEDIENARVIRRCNEGGVTAYVKNHLDGKNSETVSEGTLRRSSSDCQVKTMKLFDPTAIVTVNITDWGVISDSLINTIRKGQEAGLFFLNSEQKHDMSLKVLQSTHNNLTNTVQKEKESKWTNIVTGVMHEETLDIPDLTFIDPILTVGRANTFRKNVVFLLPIVEQQLYVLAEYVASLPDRTIHAVIRGESARGSLDLLRRSLLNFGVTLTSSVFSASGVDTKNALGASGLTVVIGVDDVDIPIFVAHLEQNTKARLVILFNPFAVFYKDICAAFKGKDSAERLLIITNLPHWDDENSTSRMIQNYHNTIVDPSAWSPMSLQSFIAGRVIGRAVKKLHVVNWSSVSDYFYSVNAVNVDDMSFGPFTDSSSVTCTSGSDPNGLECGKNFGATSISIWPMSRVFDPNIGVIFGPVAPSLEYRVPTGLTKNGQIGAIVGTLLGAAVLAAIIGLLFYCFCKSNVNAPKNPGEPVTMIFTDIQSSTALWAACPEIMTDAVETHQKLIRRLIAKYKCYEVKTVGDSFMIACKSAYAAVQLVGDLQRTFLQHDWGTITFDNAYHYFEDRQAEEDADYKPPTARLDDAVYREYWNGLRVRAGVHTGLSDIRFDEVTKRYDYYGPTAKTAARTESIANGGQVLLTRAAYMALSTAERTGLNVTALDAVELRGVPEPVEMLQLNAVPGRTFAKLRQERGNDECDFDTRTLLDTETSSSLSESLNPVAENVFSVLHDICAPFPPQQRLKALGLFCNRWNVMMPVENNEKDVLAVWHLSAQRLAMKISRVIEHPSLPRGSPTVTSELFSSTWGSCFLLNALKASSFKGNLFFKRGGSRCSLSVERQFVSPCTSLIPQRGSPVFSSEICI